MSTPALIMWAVVFAVGVPAAWLNPTAAALVLAKISGWAIYKITGDNLPVEYYLFPDVFVIAMIMAKYERSVPDRIVLLIFPIMWCLYLAPLHPFYVWWSLWALVIAQFLAAGADSFLICWRSHPVVGRETERDRDFPSNTDRFVEINVPAQVQGYAAMSEACPPTPVFGVPGYAAGTAGVPAVFLSVPHIRPLVAIAQIHDAIIRWVAVNVVNHLKGPPSIVHGPSNPVSVGGIAQHPSLPVSKSSGSGKGFFPSVFGIETVPSAITPEHAARTSKPKESTSLWLIAKKLTKRFRGRYFSDSHCAVPSREGQGRAVLQAPFRPAFSSINHPVPQLRGADAVRKTPDFSGALLTANGGGGSG